MTRVWLAAGIALAACGYNRPADVPDDGDVTQDVAPIDDMPPGDGPDIDAPPSAMGAPCDPFDQDSCSGMYDRCAWIWDGTGSGASGCALQGTIGLNQACTTPAMGTSDCMAGTECVSGRCQSICSASSAVAPCGANYACVRYAGLFETEMGGLCIEGCDPLTQATLVTATPACGSTNPSAPNQGCYFLNDGFTCAPVPSGAATRTDRMVAFTGGGGGAFANGCAAGYVVVFFETTGSTVSICSGLCAAAKTDAAMPTNVRGDPSVPVKLHNTAAPLAGDGVCINGKKGSQGQAQNQNCVFLWRYSDDPSMVTFAPDVGVCMAKQFYSYGNPARTVPSCHTLPPGPTPPANCTCPGGGELCTGTGCPDGLASQWDCYPYVDATPARPLNSPELRIAKEPTLLHRHHFE